MRKKEKKKKLSRPKGALSMRKKEKIKN